MKIVAVIPTKDEEEGLKCVLSKIPKDIVSEVVVIDGSSDNTEVVAKKNNATVVKGTGQGKGFDFQIFLKEYDLDSGDIYVMLDADDTYDPQEIEKMIQPIVDDKADVVMGTRFNGTKERMEDGAMGPVNHFGNYMLTIAGKILYDSELKDLCTGYWAFSKEALMKIRIDAKGFDLEANLFSESVKKNLRIASIPITYKIRVGENKLKVLDGLWIFKRLIKEKVN